MADLCGRCCPVRAGDCVYVSEQTPTGKYTIFQIHNIWVTKE